MEYVIYYLDDFLFGGHPNSDSCGRSLDLALRVCDEVGFPAMPEKVVGPSTLIEFLGFINDTGALEIRLPEEKLLHLKSTLESWRLRKSCKKRELPSLIGCLQHASTVVKPGRTFLRRMIKRQTLLDSYLRLNTDFRADLQWWATFICSWNGVSIVTALCRHPIDAKLVSDASGSWGCGAYFGDRWFSLSWTSCLTWADMHITVKELLPIVISCAIWGREMAGRHIRSLCDNAAVVAMINKYTSTNPMAMRLLRCLHFICAKYAITLSAEHILGSRNTAADALSRNKLSEFFEEKPAAQKEPSAITVSLMEVLINRQPNWLSADWSRSFQICV